MCGCGATSLPSEQRSVMENIEICEPQASDVSAVDGINRLLGQLTQSPEHFTAERLAAISASAASRLWLLRVDGRVAGMLAMGLYTTPTGRKAWIEDVVVDTSFRGRGLGRMLVERALAYAREWAPVTVMLTSRPSREAANGLYRSVGFELKHTNLYKLDIDEK